MKPQIDKNGTLYAIFSDLGAQMMKSVKLIRSDKLKSIYAYIVSKDYSFSNL